MRKILIALFSCMCMPGCSLPLPLSESIMFLEEQTEDVQIRNQLTRIPGPKLPRYSLGPGHHSYRSGAQTRWIRRGVSRYLFGISQAGNIISAPISDYGKELLTVLNQEESNNYSIPEEFGYKPLKIGVSGGIGFASSNVFGLALNLGVPVFAFDATLQPAPSIFVTVNVSPIDKAYEIILQRKMSDGNRGGFALGVFYRNDRYTASNSLFSSSLPDEVECLRVQSYGLRGIIQIALTKEKLNARFVATLGYSPELNAPMSNIGFVINTP